LRDVVTVWAYYIRTVQICTSSLCCHQTMRITTLALSWWRFSCL